MRSLAERVAVYVRSHPGETIDEVARGVRARTSDVRDVLLGEGFSSRLRNGYEGDRARVYDLSGTAGDGRGRVKRPSQCDRVVSVLRDGGWHTAAEIHQRCGFMRLNSRIAELRSRGLDIVCEHVAGRGTGPDAYQYRLIETTEEAATDPGSPLTGGIPACPAASSGVSADELGGSPAAPEQLRIGAAA